MSILEKKPQLRKTNRIMSSSKSTANNSPAGSDQAYLDIINAAVSAATSAGAAPPPAANTNLADMQRRLSSDLVSGGSGNGNNNGGNNSNNGAVAAGATAGLQPQPRSSSVESYPLSAGSSASPMMEPDFYGTPSTTRTRTVPTPSPRRQQQLRPTGRWGTSGAGSPGPTSGCSGPDPSATSASAPTRCSRWA